MLKENAFSFFLLFREWLTVDCGHTILWIGGPPKPVYFGKVFTADNPTDTPTIFRSRQIYSGVCEMEEVKDHRRNIFFRNSPLESQIPKYTGFGRPPFAVWVSKLDAKNRFPKHNQLSKPQWSISQEVYERGTNIWMDSKAIFGLVSIASTRFCPINRNQIESCRNLETKPDLFVVADL